MKFSVFIATSLDGYIARPDGDIEWLFANSDPNDKEDYGYADFMSTVNCIVMGRNTFEKVLSFPEWPYDKPVIVISKTMTILPESCVGKVEIFSGTIADLQKVLEDKGYERIYLDGGKTIQSFLQARIVTDIVLTRIPVLIGSGLPLFGSLDKDLKLKHLETKSYSSGFVQSKYGIENS